MLITSTQELILAMSSLEVNWDNEPDLGLQISLSQLMTPRDSGLDSFWETPGGQYYLNYRCHVIAEFVRASVNKEFDLFPLKKQTKVKGKRIIRIEAALVSRIWKCLRLLPPPRYCYDSILLNAILDESWLAFFLLVVNRPERTATDLIKTLAHENKQLQSLTNPFLPHNCPHTYDFIERCVREASKSREFETHYRELIEERMTLTALLRGDRVSVEPVTKRFRTRTEKRGRKPKSKSK